jgi:S1-C subfamily serine protease
MKIGSIVAIVCAGALGLAVPMLMHREDAPRPQKKTPAASPEPQTAAKPSQAAKPSPEPKQAAPKPAPEEKKIEDLSPLVLEAPKKDTKLNGQTIYERALPSTVWINNPGTGFGSGTLINAKDRLVLTNYHVVFRRTTLQKGTVVQSINSALTATDAKDKSTNYPYKMFEYQFARSFGYLIDMESKQLDSYLQIVDARDQIIAADDDSGSGLNAQIYFIPPQDGKYRIVATTFAGGTGNFTLKISKIDFKGAPPTPAAGVSSYLFVNFPETIKGKVIPDKSYYQGLFRLDKEKFKATVIAYSEAKDLAVLKLNWLPPTAVPLPLAKESSQPGQMVHSIGNPGTSGALWVYTSGTVRTAPYQKSWQSTGLGGRMNHDAVIIETQSPTNPGDSGGPLMNDNVELVAVTQGGSLYGNSISLFVDVQDVRGFLKAKGLRWAER